MVKISPKLPIHNREKYMRMADRGNEARRKQAPVTLPVLQFIQKPMKKLRKGNPGHEQD